MKEVINLIMQEVEVQNPLERRGRLGLIISDVTVTVFKQIIKKSHCASTPTFSKGNTILFFALCIFFNKPFLTGCQTTWDLQRGLHPKRQALKRAVVIKILALLLMKCIVWLSFFNHSSLFLLHFAII